MTTAFEEIAATAQDQLVPGINFAVSDTASYVLQRRFASFFPSTGSDYAPNGQTVLRFQISSPTDYFDLATLQLQMTIANTGAQDLIIPGGPMTLFTRWRIYVGGTLAEDILEAHRLTRMIDLMTPLDRLRSESISQLGENEQIFKTASLPAIPAGAIPAQQLDLAPATNPWGEGYSSNRVERIEPNTSRTIVARIKCSGLLGNTHYWLPGRFPLVIEATVTSDPLTSVASWDTVAGAALSTAFVIRSPKILVDQVQLDPYVNETISKQLQDGGKLPMIYSTYFTSRHTLANIAPAAGQSWQVMLSRAFSRVQSLFVSFYSPRGCGRGAGDTRQTQCEATCFLNWHGKPNYNTFNAVNPYQPASGEGFRFQIGLGSTLWPDIPMGSMAEAWYQLSKLMGMPSSASGCSITPNEYLGTSFLIGLDLERSSATPGSGMAALTGIPSRSAGDNLRVSFDNVQPRDAPSCPTTMFVTMHVNAILELRDEGCSYYD